MVSIRDLPLLNAAVSAQTFYFRHVFTSHESKTKQFDVPLIRKVDLHLVLFSFGPKRDLIKIQLHSGSRSPCRRGDEVRPL